MSHELAACLSVFDIFLTQWMMTILLKGCIPDSFESSNFLKLSFKNIWGLHAKFGYCESFLESNSPDILTLCETHLDGSINSGNFSVRVGYLSLIWKDCLTHMIVLQLMWWKDFLLHGTYLQKGLQILSYIFFDWLCFTQCLTSFSSIDHILCLYPQFLILFHLT